MKGSAHLRSRSPSALRHQDYPKATVHHHHHHHRPDVPPAPLHSMPSRPAETLTSWEDRSKMAPRSTPEMQTAVHWELCSTQSSRISIEIHAKVTSNFSPVNVEMSESKALLHKSDIMNKQFSTSSRTTWDDGVTSPVWADLKLYILRKNNSLTWPSQVDVGPDSALGIPLWHRLLVSRRVTKRSQGKKVSPDH